MQSVPLRCAAAEIAGATGAVIVKERTMANSRPNVQLFGYPVKLRGEQDVPGFRVKPPEEEVPGFHLSPDGSARRPAERRLNLPGWDSARAVDGSKFAALLHGRSRTSAAVSKAVAFAATGSVKDTILGCLTYFYDCSRCALHATVTSVA